MKYVLRIIHGFSFENFVPSGIRVLSVFNLITSRSNMLFSPLGFGLHLAKLKDLIAVHFPCFHI